MSEKTINLIYKSFDNLNKEFGKEKLKKDFDFEIYGEKGALDSLDLVNLIVNIEELIDEEYDKSVTLADEKAMSMRNSPFKNVKNLSEYLNKLLNDK